MTGAELKEKLKNQPMELTAIATALGMTKQGLDSKLKASDIGIGFLFDVAKVVHRNVDYFLEISDGNENHLQEPAGTGLTYIQKRQTLKNSSIKKNEKNVYQGIPIYDVPIDAGFIERFRDNEYEPMYFLNIPKLRNCNFGAIVSGSSMYPIMKSGTIAVCRIVDQLDYFDPGEMYFISTVNGFETVKYVQQGEQPDEMELIPHNAKIKPSIIKKSMVVKMCIVEAWLNFR